MRKRIFTRNGMILALMTLGLGSALPACTLLPEEELATDHEALAVYNTESFRFQLRLRRFGGVNPRTGVAVITGVAFCSEPATVEFDESELRQERGRNLAFDSFFREFHCEGETPFRIVLEGDDGSRFRPGRAQLTLDIFAITEDNERFSDFITTNVVLRPARRMP